MRLWRLTKAEHAPGLDGEGARLWGGRWNSPGVPMIYTATSLALAALEYLVHLPPAMRRGGALPPLVTVELWVDDSNISESALTAADLRTIADSRDIGDSWATGLASLGLAVPSIIIPRETNVLLNPHSPVTAGIELRGQQPFQFDTRLFG